MKTIRNAHYSGKPQHFFIKPYFVQYGTSNFTSIGCRSKRKSLKYVFGRRGHGRGGRIGGRGGRGHWLQGLPSEIYWTFRPFDLLSAHAARSAISSKRWLLVNSHLTKHEKPLLIRCITAHYEKLFTIFF